MLDVPCAFDGDFTGSASRISQSGTYQVILYKGKAWGVAFGNVSVTGDAEVSGNGVIITGDCSITISPDDTNTK